MSIYHIEQAANMRVQPAAKKLVLLCLADSANRHDNKALPGLDAIMQWSGVGRSQALKYLQDLDEEGHIKRVQQGGRGRRAEYIVFPRSDQEPPSPPVDNSQFPGSGTPDPNQNRVRPEPDPNDQMGPARVRLGSGPDRTPPYSILTTSKLGGYVQTHEEPPVENSPNPIPNPQRCPAHQFDEYPPACRNCQHARQTHEAQTEHQRLTEARQQRQHREQAIADAQAAIADCDLCDTGGNRARHRCTHDTHLEAEHDQQVAEQARINAEGIAQLKAARRRHA